MPQSRALRKTRSAGPYLILDKLHSAVRLLDIYKFKELPKTYAIRRLQKGYLNFFGYSVNNIDLQKILENPRAFFPELDPLLHKKQAPILRQIYEKYSDKVTKIPPKNIHEKVSEELKENLNNIPVKEQLTETQKEEGFFIVKKIHDHFYDRSTRQYMFLTEWEGYDEKSWEPKSNLPEISIELYWDSKKKNKIKPTK